jgi:glutamyl/glutaminyl-tRNA synthetase
VLSYDAEAARANEENAAILAEESAEKVLTALAERVLGHEGPVTPEAFKGWMNEIKTATGVKGKELFHPVRIALTGAHSGPEFDKLIPLIEDGATLGVVGIRERVERFVGV